LGFRHRPWYWSFVGNYDARPQLTFRGQWQNPDLVMDDGGTFAVAFQPDGSLSNAHYNYYQSKAPNKQQVVFHEVQGFHGWWNDCRDK
jgi:hypothetical protein